MLSEGRSPSGTDHSSPGALQVEVPASNHLLHVFLCTGHSSSMDSSGATNSFRASPPASVWSPARLLCWYLLHNGHPYVAGGQELFYGFFQWLQRNNSRPSFFSYLGVCSIVPLTFSSLLPLQAVQLFCPFLKIFSHLCHYLGQEAKLCPVVGLLELFGNVCLPHGASLSTSLREHP